MLYAFKYSELIFFFVAQLKSKAIVVSKDSHILQWKTYEGGTFRKAGTGSIWCEKGEV